MQSDVVKFFQHKLHPSATPAWRPFLSVLYLTHECDFRCSYCSDGHQTPYYTLPTNTLSASDMLKVIEAIRQHCKHLVITGGEPLQYSELDVLWPKIKTLKFSDVALTTNGFLLGDHLPAMASTITQLVISLDTLNPERADNIYGRGSGIFNRILSNLELAENWPNRQFKIVISTVLTPEGIPDAYDVYELCRKRKWEFAACPQLEGVTAHAALTDNLEYRTFFDFLLKEKKTNPHIFGTQVYLEHMRDLRKFKCRPFTMLVISPEGDVYYPCLEIGQNAGSLLDYPNLHTLRERSEKTFGSQPNCGTRCHSACALSFAALLNNTFQTLAREISLLPGQFLSMLRKETCK